MPRFNTKNINARARGSHTFAPPASIKRDDKIFVSEDRYQLSLGPAAYTQKEFPIARERGLPFIVESFGGKKTYRYYNINDCIQWHAGVA